MPDKPAKDRAAVWADLELPVQRVVSRVVEYGEDGTGRRTYRHHFTTNWDVVPDA